MKKAMLLIIFCVFILYACEKETLEGPYDIGSFSYENDISHHQNGVGVKACGFVNTEKRHISDIADIVKLSKEECTVQYDTVEVAFDESVRVYRVSFFTAGCLGGGQDVYIDRDGITRLIIYGE